jgi:hypothetical protein
MGYDIHITRRKFWADKGSDITADEWLAYVQRDSELSLRPESGRCFAEWSGGSWLDWSDGVIFTKNPDEALVTKMVAIAGQFDATVQGDDGEIYDGSESPRQPQVSLGSRIAGWFTKLRPEPKPKVEHEPLPFGVGDTVVDAWGFEHTIISIDRDANHGLGRIQSRRSSDGTEHSYAVIAHGFKSAPKK